VFQQGQSGAGFRGQDDLSGRRLGLALGWWHGGCPIR
jgi:hypothetical protein